MQCEYYYYIRESYRVTATGSVESKMHRLAAAWEQQPDFGHIPVAKTSGLCLDSGCCSCCSRCMRSAKGAAWPFLHQQLVSSFPHKREKRAGQDRGSETASCVADVVFIWRKRGINRRSYPVCLLSVVEDMEWDFLLQGNDGNGGRYGGKACMCGQ